MKTKTIITFTKLLLELRKILTLKNIRVVLKQSMILSCTVYFFNVQNLLSVDGIVSNPKTNTILLLKLIATYFLITAIFYLIPKLILRFFIHSKFRDKIRKERDEGLKNSSFGSKRRDLIIASEIGKGAYDNVMKLGLLDSKNFNEPLVFTYEQKEEVFNYALTDIYNWITLILHTGITLIIVYDYYNIWFILVLILALVVSIFIALSIVIFIFNIESFEYVRRDILRRCQQLM